MLTPSDLHLFNEGTHRHLHYRLGAHPGTVDGVTGCVFAVWAPHASHVSVIGDFNHWEPHAHALEPRGESGIWDGFVPGAQAGQRYKYRLTSPRGFTLEKADPVAFATEEPPATASRIATLDHHWRDGDWMRARGAAQAEGRPLSIYEVHLGSWRRHPDGRFLSYREAAHALADYVGELGFTHVELMPIMEHPFYGSWGYQCTGYFAPTARYGSPQDLMYLVDHLHQHGIGVLLDWVPSHFPADAHGLGWFDGTHLYEHPDPRLGFHQDWNSLIFDYGRREVRSFLLSSAMHWLETYHADGLRVDAVASMLYRDYSRQEGQWLPNRHGGREYLEATEFLRQLAEAVRAHHPDTLLIAEESTAWPGVSKPVAEGGLGFTHKWDMGWMHDTLRYMGRDTIYRRFHHDDLTFRMLYAWSEHYVLALSHDEVVHGKRSLLNKMPGDAWQQFANLRLLLGYQWVQPGKKLLFMGGEFGQWTEWNHDSALDWALLDFETHRGLHRWVRDLNRVLRAEPALHARDHEPAGFQWIDCRNAGDSVVTLLRRGRDGDPALVIACNFTAQVRADYRIGVPATGRWTEILNSDARCYGGSDVGNGGALDAEPTWSNDFPQSIVATLPPLGMVVLRGEGIVPVGDGR